MKKSEILELVKKRIANTDNRYICYATRDALVGNDQPSTEENKRALIRYIRDALTPSGTYESWLSRIHPIAFEQMRNLGINRESRDCPFRQGRLQWLDWMINCLKEKGE